MIGLIREVIQVYFKTLSVPQLDDVNVWNQALLDTKGNCFVTIFLKGDVRGSSWNIKEILPTLAEEIILNTVNAISKDERFTPLSIIESEQITLRVDIISNRTVIARSAEEKKENISILSSVDPIKNWIIVIKKDYSTSATILPNIDSKILVWTDYLEAIWWKLWESFNEDEYIIYKITTQIEYDS